MKTKYPMAYLLGALVLASIGSSCKKMLEIPANLPGQVITSNIFADSTGSVNGVIGIYSRAFSAYGPLSGYMTVYPSLTSDDMTASDPFFAPLYANQQVAGSPSSQVGTSGAIWRGFYSNTLIYQANAAIAGLNASTSISNSLRNQLIGECEVVRALCYFHLTNLYGAVPLALTTDYTVNSKLPRSSSDDIYVQIINDLTDAVGKLSVNYPSQGVARPNKYTAMALLSRVYLYRQQWQKADNLASTIISSGTYQLEALNNVFLVSNREAIWQGLTASYVTYATLEGQQILPSSSSTVPIYYLRPELLNAFEPGDLRKTAWTKTSTINGTTYYYPYKYQNRQFGQVNGRIEGEVLFRFSEQYLIRAEARINEGDLTGAASDINVIRSRAGLPNTTAQTADQLKAAVLKERQTEFFCEQGHRWFDLKRLGLLNSIIAAEKTTWPADGHAALYPVPFIEMNLNPGWSQNPGY
jgi:hypothetical protein